jgi:aromatic-L-amino-acid/L-tryptophan decarboxylase
MDPAFRLASPAMKPPAYPLEPEPEEMHRLVAAAMARIVPHIESLPDQPAAAVAGGADLARSLREALPATGQPLEELLALLFDRAIPCSFNTAGPGYLAYIPGGGLFHSALADLIGESVNRYVGVFAAAPGLAQLEANVVSWFAEIVGYPPSSRGILTSGGSLANFTALVTARREKLPADFLRGTLYASDQVHHSVQKAALLAGFPPENVRAVATDERFCLRLDHLESAIRQDRATGWQPFLVVGNAGSTNTGAVDPLAEIAALCARHGLWFHVDAAYGGFFLLTERGRRTLAGIAAADSVVLDPHKGLFLPYGTGALLVRDGEALRRAHSVSAAYLPPNQVDPDLVDFHEYSPELSRPFRGLRVWLPIKMLGVEVFRTALAEKLELAEHAAAVIATMHGVEILAAPQLSLFAFRLHPAGVEGAALDALNERFLLAINRRNRVHLTATTLPRGFALRICVLSFRTHRQRIDAALEDIEAAAREVLSAPDARPAQSA